MVLSLSANAWWKVSAPVSLLGTANAAGRPWSRSAANWRSDVQSLQTTGGPITKFDQRLNGDHRFSPRKSSLVPAALLGLIGLKSERRQSDVPQDNASRFA